MKRLRKYSALKEINITNLVDVILVLLIIFMITAPLLNQGIEVNLPQSKASQLPSRGNIRVTLTKDGTIYLDNKKVDRNQVLQVLAQKYTASPENLVILEADRQISYGEVIEVMDKIKNIGIDNLGLIVEPSEKK